MQDSGGIPKISGTTRLMQRPLLTQRSKVESGGGASELGRREEEEDAEEEEKREPSGFIYKEANK